MPNAMQDKESLDKLENLKRVAKDAYFDEKTTPNIARRNMNDTDTELISESGTLKKNLVSMNEVSNAMADDDVIEQTFGLQTVSDNRNTSNLYELPTPKSRMKREIDIERDMQNVQSAQGQTTRKRIKKEIQSPSETNVV